MKEELNYDIEKLRADHLSGDGLAPIEIDFLFQRIAELEKMNLTFAMAEHEPKQKAIKLIQELLKTDRKTIEYLNWHESELVKRLIALLR